MKVKIGFTIEPELLRRIDELRGITKRSTFMELLLKLGLEAYMRENNIRPSEKWKRMMQNGS
ncbi:MAG: hypothetical protein QXU45_08840 [Candidatus Bathyarchaeia archaeon]